METTIYSLIGLIVAAIVGYFFALSVGKKTSAKLINEAELKSKEILANAEKNAEHIKKEKLLEVKEEWHKRKSEFEQERHNKLQKITASETQLKKREENIENRMDLILRREKQIQDTEASFKKLQEDINRKTEEVKKLHQQQIQKLQEISGLSREEARRILFDSLINEVKEQSANKIKQIREETKQKAEREAQSIIIQAIQRTATDHSIESTVSVVNLDSDEMKGRIIGREGRNIRAFESATGIDLIIDDTPEAVVISGFDPFRREVAKKALEKLMLDGRIHPARIEEIVE